MAKFDSKTWNENVFQKYMQKVPNTKENSLIKNGLLDSKPNMTARLRDEVGGNYFTEPIKGLLDGDVQNYDGKTNVEFSSRDTFEQGKIIIGRMKGWEEKDFSTELTGVDWMAGMASEVKEYYDAVEQADILAILKGIFAMTDTEGAKFVEKHTTEITGDIDATALNSALQKACGDKKKQFRVAFMSSNISTQLENLNLLEYLKYSDSQGITRDLNIATWNGKLVIIDDDMPFDTETGADTIYVLGEKFFEYDNVGVKHSSEMVRDAITAGGVDRLVTKQRKLFAPKFISFTKKQMASYSPTTEELENGANWEIVNNGKSNTDKKTINDKLIPLARIIVKPQA